jgi:hypothetical protein
VFLVLNTVSGVDFSSSLEKDKTPSSQKTVTRAASHMV